MEHHRNSTIKRSQNESLLYRFALDHANKMEKHYEPIYSTAAAWLACGLDKQSCFLQTSDVPQTAELSWYLRVVFSLPTPNLSILLKTKLTDWKMECWFVFVSHVDG
jgi:tryptophanyl-tRNA synthetase